jgi:predicted outer membrane protein
MEMNVAEVELGKMVSGKTENARVKEFAEMCTACGLENPDLVATLLQFLHDAA